MSTPKYDYEKAYGRLQDLRRKVILQKGGQSVEGLTEIVMEKAPSKRTTPQKTKSQEND